MWLELVEWLLELVATKVVAAGADAVGLVSVTGSTADLCALGTL